MEPVSIEIHNSLSQIKGSLSKICIDQIKFGTSYAVPGAHFSAAYRRGFWDGRKNLFDTKTQAFPTGLLSKVRALLVQNGVLHSVQDLRVKPTPSLNLVLDSKVVLRPYQLDAANLAPKKQRGIIRAATGSGKSIIASALTASLGVPTLVLVHKRDLLWQLADTFEKSLGVPIGRIGAGVVDPKDITIAMIQTSARLFDPKIKVDKEDLDTEITNPEVIRKFIRNVQCVIADECHHLNVGQYSTVLDQCTSAFYRFGLSATPYRTDQADLIIEAHTAPKFVDVSASYLIEQGYLAAPTIYIHQFKHKKQPSELTYGELYDANIVQNCTRNEAIREMVASALKADKSVLIAVTKIEHGKILEQMLQEIETTTIFAHGGIDSKVRREILKDLDQKKRKVVISTTVFGEGVDVPNLDVLINAKSADSDVDTMQLAGRVLRVTASKTKATIIDIADEGCRFFGEHSKSRQLMYMTEPKYQVVPVSRVDQIVF